ncbi:LacI family DNA-binding transcriptional regulator [Georgenia alba]|uniref:LacI family DNA-binding transcriptional regulator n=1 Tax=Georgenia alba TaxID=2233858 RepID=A0ABW2Q831_9MICO
MAKVTLQSIADKVGVSRMTVSNAFSRPDQLSAAMRERILTTAAELGYVGPDPAARALARGRTGAVGLLFNGPISEAFEDQVAAETVAAVGDELGRRGLALTILPPPPDETFIPARDVVIDGALVYACDPSSAGVAWLARRQIPLVAMDQDFGADVPAVRIDDRGGARAGAQHLLDLGHRRIGMLTIDPGSDTGDGPAANYVSRERIAGWREPLGADHEVAIAYAPYKRHDDVVAAATRLLTEHDVTAVLCFSDAFARALYAAADAVGRAIPEDLSVVGFDDNPLGLTLVPPLTTVRQDVSAKGRLAVTALADLLQGRSVTTQVLPTELVVRDSTAPPSGARVNPSARRGSPRTR